MFSTVASIVVLLTAVAVAADASRLGARKGALGGGTLDMGPASWFFACLLIWIIGFPCYLVARPRLVRRARALDLQAAMGSPTVNNYGGSQPIAATDLNPTGQAMHVPPGYYPNPAAFSGGPSHLWWDGQQWAATPVTQA